MVNWWWHGWNRHATREDSQHLLDLQDFSHGWKL